MESINLGRFSIKVTNLKCFGGIAQGFDDLKPINVLIGRNNSGKSALLDLVYFNTLSNLDIPREQWQAGKEPTLLCSYTLTEDILRIVFPEKVHEGSIPGSNNWRFGKRLIDAKLTWKRLGNKRIEFDQGTGERLAQKVILACKA